MSKKYTHVPVTMTQAQIDEHQAALDLVRSLPYHNQITHALMKRHSTFQPPAYRRVEVEKPSRRRRRGAELRKEMQRRAEMVRLNLAAWDPYHKGEICF